MGDDAMTVGEIAEMVRSKNAGPFWITFDIFLRTGRVDPTSVMIYLIPSLRVVKISFPAARPTGKLLRPRHALRSATHPVVGDSGPA